MQKNIIGVDLGATSGRVILARAGDDRLRMEELHRFPNRMREIDGRVVAKGDYAVLAIAAAGVDYTEVDAAIDEALK